MQHFPSSYYNLHILFSVDYVTKWVDETSCVANDARSVVIFLKKNIFPKCRTPRILISDVGKHFCNKYLENVFKKYNVKHKFASPNHPKTNGQVKVSTGN